MIMHMVICLMKVLLLNVKRLQWLHRRCDFKKTCQGDLSPQRYSIKNNPLTDVLIKL